VTGTRGAPVSRSSLRITLTMRSFEEHDVVNTVYRVADGAETLDFLFRRGEYTDPKKSPRPNLILLDLRMPKIDGLERTGGVEGDQDIRYDKVDPGGRPHLFRGRVIRLPLQVPDENGLGSYVNTPPNEILLCLFNGVLAKVEDGCGKGGVRSTFGEGVVEVFDVSGAP
jgi:hypothetical protein